MINNRIIWYQLWVFGNRKYNPVGTSPEPTPSPKPGLETPPQETVPSTQKSRPTSLQSPQKGSEPQGSEGGSLNESPFLPSLGTRGLGGQ